MFGVKKTAGYVLLLASLFVLAACSSPAAASPTADPNVIYTAAAQTVQAQLTKAAALTPSATAVPPTATTAPTNTQPAQQVTTPLAGTQIVLPTLPLPGSTTMPTLGLPTLPPLVTSTVALPASGDKGLWVSQTPEDGATVVKGAKFDVVWRLRNTGTTTWTTKYQYRYFSGSKLTEDKTAYFLKTSVKPNEEVDLVMDALAPSKTGEYMTNWVITNEQGTNFYSFNITIKVVEK